MLRPAARFCLLLVSAALLAGIVVPAARADGPALTAKFGVAGRYRPGGWCLVTVGVQNPGPDTLSGQIQVVATSQTARSPYGRGGRQDTSTAVFACPVSVPGGSAGPHFYPLYLRGIDPGQADLTVQLVEGRERGDGHVLASINNQNQNTSQAFTGNPLAPNDSLLVGFGGDPGAFTFLGGRSLPSSAAPPINRGNPNGLNSAAPATAQVAEAATAADLPDKAAGYDGVSAFLLRSDAPIEAMTEAQSDALRGWVAGGGHLIVCGGPDATRFGSVFFTGLLPATVSAASASGALTLAAKPLPGVRVLQAAPGGGAQIVSGPYGAGTVTVTAFDPTGPAFQAAMTLPPVWQTLLFSQTPAASSVLGITAAREENLGGGAYYGSSPPLLSEAVMRGPSLDAPGTSVIAIFLLVYLIILVPVNYFVLKKYDRKELAWVTIPTLVFVFAAGTFGVGYAAKGGSVFVNRAALIETNAGQTQAGVYSEVGLFSPHRTTYDIGLAGNNLLAAVPNPGVNYGGGSGGESQGSGPAQFVETQSGVSLPSTPVNMWAMRAFDAQSTTDLGGAIDGALSDNSASVKGALVNHTSYALTDCAVLYAGRWHFIGTLASGATVTLPANSVAVLQPMFPGTTPIDAKASIHERMYAALGDYFRSLSQSSPNYNGGTVAPVYSPAPGEALLAGWSSDPNLAGPAPRIDGRPVTENDVSLVIVHLPVSGAPQPIPAAALPGTNSGGFGIVRRAARSYRQARDTRTLSAAQAAALVGHVVRLRGTVFVFSQMGGSATLGFAPNATPSRIHVALPFSSWRNPAQSLIGREVILTGTLTHSGSGILLVVSHPNWVQVVQ